MRSQRVLESLCRMAGDPRMADVIARFYAVRGCVRVKDAADVAGAVRTLLVTIADVLEDQGAVRRAEAVEDGADALEESAATVRDAADTVLGEAFPDTTAALFVFCERLGADGADGAADAEAVLGRVDELLAVMGVADAGVSVCALWRDAEHTLGVEGRQRLWAAVTAVLRSVARQCSLP